IPGTGRRSSQFDSTLSCRAQPRIHPFRYQLPLELSHRRQNIQLKLSAWIPGRRIDALAWTDQSNVVYFQFSNDLRQMAKGARKTVDFERNDRIDLPPSDLIHHLIERIAILFGTRSNI